MSNSLSIIKRELILGGLNCAHCAEEINNKVNKLESIESANLNFINKTLIINIDSSYKEDDVLKDVIDIIDNTEPGLNIKVKEEKISKLKKTELILNGLNCAHCAEEINDKVSKLNGVKDSNLNFISKVLTINLAPSVNKFEIINEAINIINNTEPGLDIQIKDNKKELSKKDNEEFIREEEKVQKKELLKIGFGTIVYILGILESSMNFKSSIINLVYLIAYLIIGGSVLSKAYKNALNGKVFDENFLMSIATIGAIAIGEMPEAVGVMLFYKLGEYLQGKAVGKSRKSISALMEIRPDYANVKVGSDIKVVSPYEVEEGDLIVVKPGERVPLDGNIIEGSSMIDTSALTGESVPREVNVGDEILSGAINKNGLLTINVTKEFEESTVSKILELVQNASSKKSKTENFISKFCKYYTPIVIALATLIAVVPPIFIQDAAFSDWFYRGLVFLVVSCPCALVLSVPLSFFSGIGVASKQGVLIKGSNYLEALRNVDTVVFDKTGTLTKGVFDVTKIKPVKMSESELLEYAAIAEVNSNHPIAKSIVSYYGRDINTTKISKYEEIAAYGIAVEYDGKFILAGNEKLMKKYNIFSTTANEIGTVVYISVNGSFAGYIVISDEIKEDSKLAIKNLKANGVSKVVMLTGDNKVVGDKVAKELDIDVVYSNLLPGEKVNKLEELYKIKDEKSKIAFVGDGINDAPVLARADIGVAMGGIGSDAAIEAADVVLMKDKIEEISEAIRVSRRTNKILWQNIIFSLGVKIIVMLLVVLGLTNMWAAVFADVGVTLIAVLNSMRIIR